METDVKQIWLTALHAAHALIKGQVLYDDHHRGYLFDLESPAEKLQLSAKILNSLLIRLNKFRTKPMQKEGQTNEPDN